MRNLTWFNPLRWKLKKFVWVLLSISGLILIFYTFLIIKLTDQVVVQNTIKNITPKNVWEFVIDFSNMKKLNPTIEEFNIISENGSGNDWQYSVHYKEHLSSMTFIKNYGTAQYSTKHDDKDYFIISSHVVCFWLNICVNADSVFQFSENGTGTLCIEKVKYECPMLLTTFCSNEVMYQRKEIMKRLVQNFSASN